MNRIVFTVVLYADGDPESIADGVHDDLDAVDVRVVRADPITSNADGEHLASEIEPLFDRPGHRRGDV